MYKIMSGRARVCQVYPEMLARAILRGIKQELKHGGILAMEYQDLLVARADEEDRYDYDGHFVDDMLGQVLNTKLVTEAGNEEMATYFAHDACEEKTFEECWQVTGKAPIGADGSISVKGTLLEMQSPGRAHLVG